MKRETFIDKIVDLGWEWADTHDGYLVRKKNMKLHVPFDTIEKHDFVKLFQQMKSFDVKHMTRVVGYYSLVENWNPSKIGELKDRQKGDYVVGTHTRLR